MKKLALGCFVASLLLAVAGVIGTYWIYRKVSTTVSQFAELSAVPEIERQVRNTAPFTPPASAELTDEQLDKLVEVQGRVRARLGARFGEFQQRYRTLLDKREATAIDAPQIVSAYRDIAAAWLDAKRAQVDSLNAVNLSLDEYRWVRSQAYAAIGVPFMELDVAKIVSDVMQGGAAKPPGQIGGAFEPTGPEANRARVERVKAQLEDNIALASFGL